MLDIRDMSKKIRYSTFHTDCNHGPKKKKKKDQKVEYLATAIVGAKRLPDFGEELVSKERINKPQAPRTNRISHQDSGMKVP